MGGKPSKAGRTASSGSGFGAGDQRHSLFSIDSLEPIFLPNFGVPDLSKLHLPPEPQPSAPSAPPLSRNKQVAKRRPPSTNPNLVVNRSGSSADPKNPPLPLRRESLAPSKSVSTNMSTFGNTTSSPEAQKLARTKSNASTASLPTGTVSRRVSPCPREYKRSLMIAKFTFVADGDNEMSLEEGDQLYLLDDCEANWWYVESKTTAKRGFVPKSHICQAEIREDWWAGNISRILAERRVLQPDLPVGSFLVREKPADNIFVLTIKDQYLDARHYEIKQLGNGKGFTLGDEMRFTTLQDLVEHYRSQSGGLCTILTKGAPPVREETEMLYTTMASWEVKRESIRLIQKVGQGQFGEVYQAKWENVDVAVKTLKDDATSRDFFSEANFLTKLDHVNLVKLLAVCTKEKPFYIITEYMRNGSLLELLKLGVKKNHLTVPGAINVAAQVASGMAYLEDRNKIHRDLAARNVLVGEITDNVPFVKIADFGLARELQPGDEVYSMSHNTSLPVKWMSPESYYDQAFSSKSDVWSYGIFLYELVSLLSKRSEKVDHGYRLPRPEVVPEVVYENVFLACLHKDPEKRPSFHRLFKFFDEYYAYSNIHKTRTVPEHLKTPI
ncbi:unnamed protein product [Caenorhabditis auriculariae]|uniref:Tyrosine-protein kinase n=1 Tax=Caenorhabditis auriculariae TaxID=2777116 RepID=A0A8S1GSE4_9PELO|nr:unnamed protein product [Caenorhabditis auriculariae]